jgi:hypothetical protein
MTHLHPHRSPKYRLALGLLLPLALAACLRSPQESSEADAAQEGLKAKHGGARIALPDIDPQALLKSTSSSSKIIVDTLTGDTVWTDSGASAWFSLTISGQGMRDMQFVYALGSKSGGHVFEIKNIPAGPSRRFLGQIILSHRAVTHEGETYSDIKAGQYTDVRLYLRKAQGSAGVCVIVEGFPLPPCADSTVVPPDTLPNDTLPKDTVVTPPWPAPIDSGWCWSLHSPWVSGQARLTSRDSNGYAGTLITGRDTLPFTTWRRSGDALSAILVSSYTSGEKWIFNGMLRPAPHYWSGFVHRTLTSDSAYFEAKGYSCPVADTNATPRPKPDTLADTTTLPPARVAFPDAQARSAGFCMMVNLNPETGCSAFGFAKISVEQGLVTHGNIFTNMPGANSFTSVGGQLTDSQLNLFAVTSRTDTAASGTPRRDTLSLKAVISTDRTAAKGEFILLPDEQRGTVYLTPFDCGRQVNFPASTCK